MAGSLMDVFVKIGADTSGLQSGIDKAKGLASGLGSAIGTGMKVVGAAVGAATAAVGAFGASAVKVGASFDSAMSQVSATLGYTTEDIKNNANGAGDAYDALRAKAEEAGRTTIFSASESAEGLNILAMSGYNAEQSIAMLDDVLHLAAAGSMDMASAAGYISGAMKGFADESKDSAYYADLMAKGATLANTSVSQLGEAMSAGAAGAAAYGQSADSMTVALLRLAEQGETGSAAGTALAAAMKDLYTGTDQAKKALIELGVDAYDPVTHEARDFNDVVNDLEASMEGMTDEEKNSYKQTIFGIQGLNAYNKMVVTSIDKQNEWAYALENSAGEAEKQYGTMTDNLEGDIAGWNSALDGFKIAISDGLMPSIREFVQFGTDGLSKITDAFKKGGLSGAVDAFSEVLTDAIGMITSKLPDFINAGMKVLGALGKGILDNLPQIVDAAVDIVMQIVVGISNALPQLAAASVQIITQLITGLVENFPQLIEGAGQFIEALKTAFSQNSGALLEAGATLLTYIWDGISTNLPVFIANAAAAIPDMIGQVTDFIKNEGPQFLSAGVDLIADLADGLMESFPEIVSALTELIVQMVFTLTDPTTLAKLVTVAGELIMTLANGILEAIPKLLDAIPQVISNLVGAIVASLPEILAVGIQLLLALITGLIQTIPRLVMAIPAIITALVGGLVQGVQAIMDVGKDMVEGLWKGIQDRWSSLVEDFKNLASGLVDGIKGLFGISSPSKVFAQIGRYVDEGFANGINAYSGLVDDAMSNITDIPDVNAEANITAKNGGSGFGDRNVTINVYGAVGQSEEKLADIVANKLRDQVISIGAMA